MLPAESGHPRAWGLFGDAHSQTRTLYERTVHVTDGIDLCVPSIEPAHSYRQWDGLTIREAFYGVTQTALIHPAGWITSRNWRLDQRPVIDYQLRTRPGLRRELAKRLTAPRTPWLPTAVSLRTIGETNYYHVLNDLLGGSLRLAEHQGLSSDVPLVISENLAVKPFFRELQRFPRLAGRNWFQQRNREFVKVGALYFAETARPTVEAPDFVRYLLDIPDSDPGRQDRLFVVRDPGVGRSLTNHAQIAAVCARYGFRMVDTGVMTLMEQVEAFSNAGYVAGAHGAGLLNIIFRRNAPLRLLEIFPSPPMSPVFFLLCRYYGFDYQAIIGASDQPWVQPYNSAFWLDPDLLSTCLADLLR